MRNTHCDYCPRQPELRFRCRIIPVEKSSSGSPETLITCIHHPLQPRQAPNNRIQTQMKTGPVSSEGPSNDMDAGSNPRFSSLLYKSVLPGEVFPYLTCFMFGLPSGKLTWLWKITIFNG